MSCGEEDEENHQCIEERQSGLDEKPPGVVTSIDISTDVMNSINDPCSDLTCNQMLNVIENDDQNLLNGSDFRTVDSRNNDTTSNTINSTEESNDSEDTSIDNDKSLRSEPKNNNKNTKKVRLSVLLANARSLAPKIDSLLDYFRELDLDLGIITESWLKDGRGLKDDEQDLELGENIKLIHRNRKSRRGRTAGGGVLIAFDQTKVRLKERTIRRGQSEVVCAVGRKTGLSRQILVMSVYLPPKLSIAKSKEALEFVNEAVGRAKEDLNDPIIIIGGDFNNFCIGEAIDDYPDLRILESPPTRLTERLDLLVTNIESENDSRTTVTKQPPLETSDGRKSDHDALWMESTFPSTDRFKKSTYWSRPKTKAGLDKFDNWIKEEQWTGIIGEGDANIKADAFIGLIDRKMNECFPLKLNKVKSTDLSLIHI